jgi:hypothetical protein
MDEIDRLALEYITQAISETIGDREAAESQAVQLAATSPRVMYAALCYISESEPWETLLAAVQSALSS